MIQQQIVEYIKAQLKVGVGEEIIKKTLVDAGWSIADVDDSIQGAAQKKTPEIAGNFSTSPISRQSESTQSASSNRPINLKELFGNTGKEDAFSETPAGVSKKLSQSSVMFKNSAFPQVSEAGKFPSQKKPGGSKIVLIVLVVVALAAIGAAIFFFINNRNLAAQVDKLTTDNATAGSAASGLSAQIADITKSKQDIDTQYAAIIREADHLRSELSFFVSRVSSTGTISVFLSGTLAVDGKGQYSLTTSNNLTVLVKNSIDEKVDSALKPLVGKSVEISGTHTPFSKDVIVTAVDGSPL